jgi:hypothetical protein
MVQGKLDSENYIGGFQKANASRYRTGWLLEMRS